MIIYKGQHKTRFIENWLKAPLSYFIHRIVFRKEDPTIRATGIEKSTRKHNDKPENKAHCNKCKATEFTKRISGNDGLFSIPHEFYKCVACGNEQDKNGSHYKWKYENLAKERIVEITDCKGRGNTKYRYILIKDGEIALMMFIIFMVFITTLHVWMPWITGRSF